MSYISAFFHVAELNILNAAESYRISNLDEAFLRYLVTLEHRKRDTRRKLQLIYLDSLHRTDPVVAQFDFRVSPVKFMAIPYKEVLKSLEPWNDDTCAQGNTDCCVMENKPCCARSIEALVEERGLWDKRTEILYQAVFVGMDCHSTFVFRKEK